MTTCTVAETLAQNPCKSEVDCYYLCNSDQQKFRFKYYFTVVRIPPSAGYGDRSVGGGYSAMPAATAYNSPGLANSNMGSTASGYGAGPTNYNAPVAGYGAPTAGVYDNRGTSSVAAGYSSMPATGGYGDNYSTSGGRNAGGYDSAYPPLPQQRG